MKPCPHRFTLEQHLRGKTSGHVADELDEHLSTCGECLVTIDTMDTVDGFTEQIARGVTSDSRNAVTEDLTSRIAQNVFNQTQIHEATLLEAQSDDSDLQVVLAGLSPSDDESFLGSFGRYAISGVLGEGGMGIVLGAFDTELQRDVALKILRPSLSNQRLLKQRFLREARAGASLSHDHVAPVFDVGEHDDMPFISMALLQGETLQQRLKQQGTLSTEEAIRITQEVAKALQAAHCRGLIHRDIKPENVWLDEGTDRVRIVDFGLAGGGSSDSELTQSGAVMGTPRYMSPEQATCADVDHRTDLFSLGSMLYRMTTGQCAVVGSSAAECFASLLNGDRLSANQANPDVPMHVSSLISDLMEPDPADRVSSAEVLLRRLESLPQPHSNASHVAAVASNAGSGGNRTTRSLSSWFWGAGGLVLLGIIVITIRHKDGTTSRIEVDESNVKSINIDFGNDKTSSAKTITLTSPRATAQWVLDSGGKIRIETEQKPGLHAVTELPSGDFRLVDITWPDEVSPRDFDRIANHVALKFLTLTVSPDFTPNDFNKLSSLKSLRYLNLTIPAAATKIGDDDASVICELPELQMLELKSPVLNGRLFQNFRSLKKFEHLSLDLPKMTDDTVRLIAENPTMYVLRILNGQQLTDVSLQHLKSTRLIQLFIQSSQITGSGFQHLATMKDLAWLTVMDSPVADSAINDLVKCRRLNHLNLSGTNVADACAQALTQLESLELLVLNNCQISDVAAATLAKARKLKQLWLVGTQITKTGLKELATSSTLIRLSLSGPAITDAGIQHLSHLQSLTYLELQQTSVSASAASALREAIPNLKVIRTPN